MTPLDDVCEKCGQELTNGHVNDGDRTLCHQCYRDEEDIMEQMDRALEDWKLEER